MLELSTPRINRPCLYFQAKCFENKRAAIQNQSLFIFNKMQESAMSILMYFFYEFQQLFAKFLSMFIFFEKSAETPEFLESTLPPLPRTVARQPFAAWNKCIPHKKTVRPRQPYHCFLLFL